MSNDTCDLQEMRFNCKSRTLSRNIDFLCTNVWDDSYDKTAFAAAPPDITGENPFDNSKGDIQFSSDMSSFLLLGSVALLLFLLPR